MDITEKYVADGWSAPAPLPEMIGRKVVYHNPDGFPAVTLLGWLDSIDEGWAVVEFESDSSKATVRPSRIVAFK